jgi:hypothetical protein
MILHGLSDFYGNIPAGASRFLHTGEACLARAAIRFRFAGIFSEETTNSNLASGNGCSGVRAVSLKRRLVSLVSFESLTYIYILFLRPLTQGCVKIRVFGHSFRFFAHGAGRMRFQLVRNFQSEQMFENNVLTMSPEPSDSL